MFESFVGKQKCCVRVHTSSWIVWNWWAWSSFLPTCLRPASYKVGVFWSSPVLLSNSAQDSKERTDLAGKKVLGPREKGDGEERRG